MRRSKALLLRRSIPLLLAVAALLGPGPAWAGGPAPDPSGSGAPAPDAAPVEHPKATPAAAGPVAVPVREPAVAAPTFTPRVTSTAPVVAPHRAGVAPVRKHVARAKKPAAQHPDVKIIDVPPLRVDVHRGLGAVTRSLHDESLLLLAGIALLVATFTAASGTTLALIATRTPRRRR